MSKGDYEPRGCPTPGACSGSSHIEQLLDAVREATVAIGLAKAIPAVASEYDFEPAYQKLTDALRAHRTPLCRASITETQEKT